MAGDAWFPLSSPVCGVSSYFLCDCSLQCIALTSVWASRHMQDVQQDDAPRVQARRRAIRHTTKTEVGMMHCGITGWNGTATDHSGVWTGSSCAEVFRNPSGETKMHTARMDTPAWSRERKRQSARAVRRHHSPRVASARVHRQAFRGRASRSTCASPSSRTMDALPRPAPSTLSRAALPTLSMLFPCWQFKACPQSVSWRKYPDLGVQELFARSQFRSAAILTQLEPHAASVPEERPAYRRAQSALTLFHKRYATEAKAANRQINPCSRDFWDECKAAGWRKRVPSMKACGGHSLDLGVAPPVDALSQPTKTFVKRTRSE